MEEKILQLLTEDYYSLWEVRDVISRTSSDITNDAIKEAVVVLVGRGEVQCFVSLDLGIDRLVAVSSAECIYLLQTEENWLVPTEENSQIVRLTVAGPVRP